MVNIFMALITGIIGMIMLTIIMAIMLYRASFRNHCSIARQTGSSDDDVIWIKDRFRVKNKNGFWLIQFLRLKDTTSSVPGKFWTKFIAPKKMKKVLAFSEEEWKSRDLSKLIQRGIMFYETNEGEFHPIALEFKTGQAKMHVISQDSRQFLINEIKDINSLTKNRFKELLITAMAILACFILAVIFIIGIIYMKESAQESLSMSQQACIDYYRVVQNITGAVNDAGGNPTFMDDAVNFVQTQGS